MSNIVGADMVIAPPTQATPAAAPSVTDYITIADASDGLPLPQPIINLTVTTGFAPHGGYCTVESSNGLQSIHYTGVTTNTITGCTGGTGFLSAGTPVIIGAADPIAVTTVTDAQAANYTYTDYDGAIYTYAILPTATLYVESTTGFASSGDLTVQTQSSSATVNYTGTTATSFTGCTTAVAAPTSGQPPTDQTLFRKSVDVRPAGGGNIAYYTVEMAYPDGESVTVGPVIPPRTTIAVGSNNVALPQATIYVASTTPFASSGTVYVATTTGIQAVTYTGVTSTTFTGCSGGTGVMTTGGQVDLNNGPYWTPVTFATTHDPGDPGDTQYQYGYYAQTSARDWSTYDQDPNGVNQFPVGYFVDSDGFCHLRGTVVIPGRFGVPTLNNDLLPNNEGNPPAYYTFNGSNTPIFTMPASVAPLQNWPAVIAGGSGSIVTIQVTASGCQLTYSWNQSYVSPANYNTRFTTVPLAGITWPVGF